MVSHGKVKTPKHIALPMTVKTLLGFSEVITPLNRFGHGLSYSQVEQIETSIAEAELNSQSDTMLPTNCHAVFIIFFWGGGWNNNDIQEETLSGKGTTHCTKGILVQERVDSVIPETQLVQQATFPKKRSHTSLPKDLFQYIAGPHQGPKPKNIDVSLLKENANEHQIAQMKDLAWFLLRLQVQDSLFQVEKLEQQVPGWTSFN